MDKKLFNLGLCSYFFIAYFSFVLLMDFWYMSDHDFSSFRLFMASIGMPGLMLIIGIVCYRKYRKRVTEDPENSKRIMTSRSVQWIGGWLILAIVMQPLSFVLFLSLGHLDNLTPVSLIFFFFYVPFIVVAIIKIRNGYRDDANPVPVSVRNLCLILISFYLFFTNSSEILQQILILSLSQFEIKWVSSHLIFIGISFILFFLAYNNLKSYDKQHHIELLTQALITGGCLLLIYSIPDILNFTYPSLPAWILVIIGILSIKIGNELSITGGSDQTDETE